MGPEFGPSWPAWPTPDHPDTKPSPDLPGERHLPAERIADQLEMYEAPHSSRAAERALGDVAVGGVVASSSEGASAQAPEHERRPSDERITRQLEHYDDARISAPPSSDGQYEPPISDDNRHKLMAIAPVRVQAASEDFSVRGDPAGRIADWQVQGDNSQRLVQTCAIASATQQANEVGIRVSQDDVLNTAKRLKLCDEEGAVMLGDYPALMEALGTQCRILPGRSVEQLASLVEHNVGEDRRHSVAITTNGVFASGYDPHAEAWDELVVFGIVDRPTSADVNHAMTVTGVVRSDAEGNHDILGFLSNDPARSPAMTVDVEAMRLAWQEIGGNIMLVSRSDDNRTA